MKRDTIIIIACVILVMIFDVVISDNTVNTSGPIIKSEIQHEDVSKIEIDNQWVYSFVESKIKVTCIVHEYFKRKGVNLDTSFQGIMENKMLFIVTKDYIRNDIMVLHKDGINIVSMYLGEDKVTYTFDGVSKIEDLNIKDIVMSFRVIEYNDFDIFAKLMSELETNNRFIENKLYYGRYQLLRSDLKWYMKRLKIKYTPRPNEHIQKKIVSLKYKDAERYLLKNKLPCNMYSLRVVYNLGRTNTYRFRNNNLPKALLVSNLPKNIKKNHSEFRKYWSLKVSNTLAKL